MQKNRQINIRKWIEHGSFDTGFLMIVMVLLTIGVVMMFSASYVSASYSAKTDNDPYFYFKRQAIFAVVGVVGMFIVSRIRVQLFRKYSRIFMILSVLLLILVLIHPYEIAGKEEFRRWLSIPGIPPFQPSEIAKFGLIVFCATVLSEKKKKKRKPGEKDNGILWSLAATALICALVIAENHLSCTILMFGIGAVMLVLGGVDTKWIVICMVAAVGGLVVFLMFHEKIIDILPIGDYAKNRLIAWLDKDSFATSIRWQTNQSLYAIGSGGLFGQGLGKSKQKHLYMPEPQNDFIFAIVCEELGFIGAVFILVLFGLLIWRGFVIAMKNSDRFSAMLVMGILSQVGLQTILNILVVTDTIPNTGISLPFFSYGGSSLLMLMAEMGVVLSVSRSSNISKR